MNSEDQDRYAPAAEGRDWRRIHHSPVFWFGIVLCLAAIIIYVWSDDRKRGFVPTFRWCPGCGVMPTHER